MCKWFKNLLNPNKLLPKDVETGLMTSMYYSVKLGEKLFVPENCVCFLSYRDKIYCQFVAGSYTLDEKVLANLLSKQFRNKDKIKKVKFDLFFVNLTEFRYSTRQVEDIPVDKKLSKVEIKTNFACKVVDADKFQSNALRFYALIRPIDAEHFVKEFVEENINRFYLKRELTANIDNVFESKSLIEYLNKKAEKIGLNIIDLGMTLWVKTKGRTTPKQDAPSFFENSSSKTETDSQSPTNTEVENVANSMPKSIDNSKQEAYNLNDTDAEHAVGKQEVCPICKSKRIANSIFCHKCGYKF